MKNCLLGTLFMTTIAFKFEPNMTAVIQYIQDNYSVHEISLARA